LFFVFLSISFNFALLDIALAHAHPLSKKSSIQSSFFELTLSSSNKKKDLVTATMSNFVMNDDYNEYSQNQRTVITKSMEIFLPILVTSRPPSSKDGIFRIGDYGCAGGKNSLIMASEVMEQLKREDSDVIVHAFLSDLPSNNYNIVFQTYQKDFPILQHDPNFYLSTATGNFYDRMFPDELFQVACSFSSMQWLSGPYELTSFRDPHHIIPCCACSIEDFDHVDLIRDHAKKDLQDFLLTKYEELVPGGLLLFSCLGFGDIYNPTKEAAHKLLKYFDPEDHSTYIPCGYHQFRHLGYILHRTREHFSLPPSSLNLIPASHRNEQDLLDAIEGCPKLKGKYEILYNQVHHLEDEFYQKFESKEYSLEKYIQMIYHFTKTWSLHTIRSMLQENEEAIEWFYKQVDRDIREKIDYWKWESFHLIVCLKKI
jgi:hypothetical protein